MYQHERLPDQSAYREVTMATKDYKGVVSSKATTRSSSTNSSNTKLLPVRYPVYHAISEVNRSFEETIQGLEHLMSFKIFNKDSLQGLQFTLEEIRALANEELTDTANERELVNSFHYERLREKYQTRNGVETSSPEESRKQKGGKKQKAARK
ncbi:MAG: hypothetical protein DMG65_19725 [Candidatus Angelobacter sp. Gp1-AA117]|nr:MAG: hypothetical protein DMG65_19725 [Candidatus Angelobacter sp. Gp1-AA117]